MSEPNLTRADLDNPYHRNLAKDSYKNRQFGGYRVATDQYTGGKVFYSCRGVDAVKSQARHYTTQTTANVDHIQPLDLIRQKYGDRLPADELKRIANSDYNLALTNEALNKRKSNLTNYQYLVKQFKDGDAESAITAINMLSAQVEADVHINIEVAAASARKSVNNHINSGKTQQIINSTGDVATSAIHSGASSALVSLTVSGLNNLASVASGEKDISTALKNVGEDVTGSFVSAAGLDVTKSIVKGIAEQTGNNFLGKIAVNDLPIAEISLAVMVAISVKRYLDGDTSAEDCAIEILLNGAGTMAFQFGMAVGGPAGAVIASFVISQITNTILIYQQEQKLYKAKVAEVNQVLTQAKAEIEHQRAVLEAYIHKELKRWDNTIDAGFDMILQSAEADDASGIARGMETILTLFHKHVLYPNLDAFDRDFYNPNASPLIL